MRVFVKFLAKVAIVLCAVFCIFQVIHWWDSRGQGFRLYKIQSKLPYNPRWDISYSQDDLNEAKKALSQPYTYLAHGFQCYVFESQDKKYVLKFFRHQRLRLPEFVMSIPSFPIFEEWRKARILSLSRRLDYLLNSCKTSWDPARRQVALLMMHLNVTKGIFPTVHITDPLGDTHDIELDSYQFILQKKVSLIKPTISRLMKEGKISEAKRRLDWIFALFIDCARNGIQDTDGALIRKNNLGLFEEEERAVYLDGGKLRKHVWAKKEFEKDLKRLYLLQKWLKEECPELVHHFEEAKTKAIAEVEKTIAERGTVATRIEEMVPEINVL